MTAGRGRSASTEHASLPDVITALHALYGEPAPPTVTDPLGLVLWENVTYLADDDRQQRAFEALREQVGTQPDQILAAPDDVLVRIASAGILAEQRAARLRQIAHIALNEFDGDLQAIRALPLARARKALQRFPSIGEPGAEKILLFSRTYPVLALDSNGLRVLLRLGFGAEVKSYTASYRSAQEAVQNQLLQDYDWLIRAHQLLRQHGKELCRRSQPRCEACPLADGCDYYQQHSLS